VTTPKTKKSVRDRRMCPELYQALLHHRAMAVFTEPTDYVFASSTGNPLRPDLLLRVLKDVLRNRLNIHLGPRQDGLHLLRHSSGSWIYQEEGPKETQVALGHANITVTLGTYVHLAEGSEARTTDDVFTRPALPAAVAPEHAN